MPRNLYESIDEIVKQGNFDVSRQHDDTLRQDIESLFTIYKLKERRGKKQTGLDIYNGILDLARVGKPDIAREYVPRFEQEIGYEILEKTYGKFWRFIYGFREHFHKQEH